MNGGKESNLTVTGQSMKTEFHSSAECSVIFFAHSILPAEVSENVECT